MSVYACLALSAASFKSVAFDEPAYLTGGFSFWRLGDFRLHPENGNLPQRWATLPLLLFQNLHFPSLNQPAWWRSNVWALGHQFLFEMGNDAERMVQSARCMMVLLGCALGIVIYSWSLQLFGRVAALLSLALFAFSPAMLAHGALVTSDMAVTLFFTASLWSVWVALQRITVGTLLCSSLSLAGLFLSKASSILMLPVLVILLVLRLATNKRLQIGAASRRRYIRSRIAQAAILSALIMVQAGVVWAAIWCSTGFRYSAFRNAQFGRDAFYPSGWSGLLSSSGWKSRLIDLGRQLQVLPESYLYGLAFIENHTRLHQAFLNGEVSDRGWPWFLAYCVLLKTPLPLFALVALGLISIFRMISARPRLESVTPLAVFFLVYWTAATCRHISIGHRHIVPIYPALFIIAGAAACRSRSALSSKKMAAQKDDSADQLTGMAVCRFGHIRFTGLTIVALIGWFIGESFFSYPNYLAYFNEIAGGPKHAFRHVVDSSLDWGQDLPSLRKWLQEDATGPAGNRLPVYLSYFGTGDPSYYGVEAQALPGYGPEPPVCPAALRAGVYCISATMLQGIYLPCPGPWSDHYEAEYHAKFALVRSKYRDWTSPRGVAVASHSARETTDAPSPSSQLLRDFDQWRLGRLCAYLKRREPDDEVGYSILIYRLSDSDLDAALLRPLD